MSKNVTLDAFDRALLGEVRRNNQTPARVLAERVGLSESAVLRRLRELRRCGVIEADVSIVSADALGLPLTMHVLVMMERENSAVLDAFVRKVKARPEVRQAWLVTGEIAFILLVQVSSMEAYDRFSRTLLNDDPNVRQYRTLITIRSLVDAAHAALPPLAD